MSHPPVRPTSAAPPVEPNRQRGLNTLLEVTRDLAAQIDIQDILATITRGAAEALSCDRASLFQYDRKRDELYTLVATELEISEIRHAADRGVTGAVAQTRSIVNVPDPHADPRWNGAVDRATGFQTRNILAAPVVSLQDGRLLGVLQLLNKNEGQFDAFDEDLLLAFTQHAAVALDRAFLVEEIQRRKTLEASLNVAREIQRGFMPTRMPDIPGYEVATWWFPNEAVGGDYCDVVRQIDGRTGLVIADVSGHGIGPALIMASARAGLRALLLEHSAPEELMQLLARALEPDLQDGRFITMVVAELDHDSHTLQYANAGHAPAMLYRAVDDSFLQLEATGLPLGVLDRPEYPQGPQQQLAIGDILVMCTDGIVEAMDAEDERFGQHRLEALVSELATAPLDDVVAEIGRQVEAHYVGESPPDDLTILAVRRNA